MNNKPKASTVNNFASAWNRLIKTAIDKDYLSENTKVASLMIRLRVRQINYVIDLENEVAQTLGPY